MEAEIYSCVSDEVVLFYVKIQIKSLAQSQIESKNQSEKIQLEEFQQKQQQQLIDELAESIRVKFTCTLDTTTTRKSHLKPNSGSLAVWTSKNADNALKSPDGRVLLLPMRLKIGF